jgi:hypothetical protein
VRVVDRHSNPVKLGLQFTLDENNVLVTLDGLHPGVQQAPIVNRGTAAS